MPNLTELGYGNEKVASWFGSPHRRGAVGVIAELREEFIKA